MPRLTFYRSACIQSGESTTDPDDNKDSYFLYLTSIFLIAEEKNPSQPFLNHNFIVFSAAQAPGEPAVEGKLKTLSCVRREEGESELRFFLENGLQLQYAVPGVSREVSGPVRFDLYSS